MRTLRYLFKSLLCLSQISLRCLTGGSRWYKHAWSYPWPDLPRLWIPFTPTCPTWPDGQQLSDWCDGDEVVKLKFKSSNDFSEARSVVSRPIQWKEGGVLNPECPANATFKMFNDQIQSIQLVSWISPFPLSTNTSMIITDFIFLGSHPKLSDIPQCPESQYSERGTARVMWASCYGLWQVQEHLSCQDDQG